MADLIEELVNNEASRKAGLENGGNEAGNNGVIPGQNAEQSADSQNNNQEAGGNQQASQANVSAEAAAPDYDKIFNEISGGLFKTKGDFVNGLGRFTDYDALQAKYTELEAKANANPFANEEIRMRNDLAKAGATKEQLKNFDRINDLGDLASLDPLEAKVMKLVLVDGVKESAARRMVGQEFDFDGLDDEDLEVAQEKLRLSSKTDFEALSKYKVSVSSVSNDDRHIHDAAKIQQIESALTPALKDFGEKFNSLCAIDLKADKDSDVFKFNIPVSKEYNQQMQSDIRRYFVDQGLPVTQENMNQAVSFARANMWDKNGPQIMQDLWTTAKSHWEEKIRAEYENTGGLPKGDLKNGATNEASYRAFQDKVSRGII